MKKTFLPAFLAGFLVGVVALGALIALTHTPSAEAQPPELPHEQLQFMRIVSDSLEGIERALQKQCP